MSLSKSLVQNSLWLTLAMVTGRGAIVLSGIIIARAFGSEAFALFAFVHVTATSISNIAMLGMMNGLPRFFARMQAAPSDDTLSQAVLAIVAIAVGLTVALLALLIIPTELLGLPDSEYRGVLLALTFSIGLNNVLIGANNGLERFNQVSFGTLAMGTVLIGGVVGAVTLGVSELTLIAYIAATLVSILLLVRWPLHSLRERFAKQSINAAYSNRQAVLNYIGPMFVATMLTNTGLWLAGRSLLGLDGGTQFFAEYSLGLQWFGLAQVAANVVGKAALPRVTRSTYFNDQDDLRATLRITMAMSLGGALIVLAGVAVLHPLILALYGPELADARWPLLMFVGAGVFASPIPVLGNVLIAEARYGAFLTSVALWWLTIVVGALIASYIPGIMIYFVVLLSYSVFLICNAAFTFRIGRRCGA